MKFFTRYEVPPSPSIEFVEPSMTEQHFKDECDINTIVKSYQATGVLPQGNREPLFGDFAEFPTDLQASQQYFDDASQRFMELPATLRREFDNDPVKLLAFLQDDNNRARAIELGLVNAPPVQQTSASVQQTSASVKPANTGNVQSESTPVADK